MHRSIRIALAATLAVGLAGCDTPNFLRNPPQVRGTKIDADQLAQLVPGTTTRADVTALLGTPTAKAMFDDNQWIYIEEVTTPVIAGTQGVDSQQVYMMTFNDKGVLTDVTHRTQADSEPVDVVARSTPSPGSSASFMQQLLGNVGKFSPGGALQEDRQGGPTNPGNF